ncbi:hypothetical protein [Tautonia plasticadhaerens]|uniref:DUF1570 domain-containing protein n=1 Tax=Tautonia plasticadhaerens TaxID=2527974 RepID=A0A518H4V1_9BACT|nr:hypothetical protein [Tautonia plasticadhaerens]QDV35863.1 hypothetical protein ElP_37710 [Tautonia plasticadhaerens]
MTRRSRSDRPTPAPDRPSPPARIARLVLVLGILAATGCSTLPTRDPAIGSTGNPLIPTRHQARVGAFRVSSNVPIEEDDPALEALAGLEGRLGRVLGLRAPDADPPIDVYILDDEHAFTTFLTFHHPELPTRRAFFLAAGEEAAVYTARGEHLEEDLRHEATHALLHRAGGEVPLWLDEGLAEYFEVEPGTLAPEAVARFRKLASAYRDGWRPDLARLEALDDVAAMSPTDYREAWAWTLLLLHGPGRDELVAHLDRLRTDPGISPALSESIRADLATLNRQFLARVAPGKADPDGSPRLTRLQSPPASAPRRVVLPADPPRTVTVEPAPPLQGFFGRVRSGIGDFLGLSPSSRRGPG